MQAIKIPNRKHKIKTTIYFILISVSIFSHSVYAYSDRPWLSVFSALNEPGSDARQRITTERQYLLKNKNYLEKRISEVQPLIRAIAQEVDKRNLPNILILLPLIESGYRLDVVSDAGAAGLWQLMPQTAERFGVQVTANFDGRYSLSLSTDAALTYLSWLGEQFNGDWLLALAAYNAGEGRIQQAQEKSKNTSYWALSLPNETEHYVPRLLALAELIQNPELFGLSLPDWSSGTLLASTNTHRLLISASSREKKQNAVNKNIQFTNPKDASLILRETIYDPIILSRTPGLNLSSIKSNNDSNFNKDPLSLQRKMQPLIGVVINN